MALEGAIHSGNEECCSAIQTEWKSDQPTVQKKNQAVAPTCIQAQTPCPIQGRGKVGGSGGEETEFSQALEWKRGRTGQRTRQVSSRLAERDIQ